MFKDQLWKIFLGFIMSVGSTAFGQILCSQALTSSAHLSATEFQAKIENLTTLKILWDQRKIGSLSGAQLMIAKNYPIREAELLARTNISKESLVKLIQIESKKRAAVEKELSEAKTTQQDQVDKIVKRARDIYEPKYLESHIIFHEINPRGPIQRETILLANDGKFHGGTTTVTVNITKSVAMMSTPMTQYAFAKLMVLMAETDPEKINPSHFKDGDNSVVFRNFEGSGLDIQMQPGNPVENILLLDVENFISKLNTLSKSNDELVQNLITELIPDHQINDFYDLPTDAQYELIVQNNGNHFKDKNRTNYSWLQSNSNNKTHPVATLNSRLVDDEFPFFDIEGNVFIFTKDRWQVTLPGGDDPIQTEGDSIVIRGNYYFTASDDGKYLRTSWSADSKSDSIGIRLVRTRP